MSEGTNRDDLKARLLARVAITAEGCWEWTRAKNWGGYGVTCYQGQRMTAHRAAYMAWRGEIPSGLHIDHLCRNRACANPEHMECVTPRENTMRGFGPTANHAHKTHCKHGHQLDADNTRVTKRGHRVCRACHRKVQEGFRERRAAKKALAKASA